ncbi:MAG: hypothetical protein LM568_06240 [Desulfurococcaceae archaeon]|nr:hypothetical protein [Desulfurococcaceae archaeon]
MNRRLKAKALIKISKQIPILTLIIGTALSLTRNLIQPTTGTPNPKDVSLA